MEIENEDYPHDKELICISPKDRLHFREEIQKEINLQKHHWPWEWNFYLPFLLQFLQLLLRRIEFFLSENKSVKNNDPDSRMNVKETADFLDCSASTIYGLVFKRQIPHEKKGRRLYFQKSELNEWLKKGRRATVEEVKSRV